MTCPLFLIFVPRSLPSLSLPLLSFSFFLFLLSCHFLFFSFLPSFFHPPSLFLSFSRPSFLSIAVLIYMVFVVPICHYVFITFRTWQHQIVYLSIYKLKKINREIQVPRGNADYDIRLAVLYIYDIVSLKVSKKALI